MNKHKFSVLEFVYALTKYKFAVPNFVCTMGKNKFSVLEFVYDLTKYKFLRSETALHQMDQ